MVIRRHWIVFVLVWLYAFVGIFISISLLVVLGMNVWSYLLNIIFWMYFSLFLYISRLNHELDMIVVTNNRVIVIEQKAFLNRTVGECNLWQITEITSEIKGFFSNMLDYGTILIKTAGNTSNFDMSFAPDPLKKSRAMLNIVDHYRDTHSFKNKDEEKKPTQSTT